MRGANLWKEVKDRLGKAGVGLSGGQQQRLCIARAIAVHPDVLLMDEPCSALDPISTLAVEDLIHELKEHYTVVIVTHNMQQAARVSDEKYCQACPCTAGGYRYSAYDLLGSRCGIAKVDVRCQWRITH